MKPTDFPLASPQRRLLLDARDKRDIAVDAARGAFGAAYYIAVQGRLNELAHANETYQDRKEAAQEAKDTAIMRAQREYQAVCDSLGGRWE